MWDSCSAAPSGLNPWEETWDNVVLKEVHGPRGYEPAGPYLGHFGQVGEHFLRSVRSLWVGNGFTSYPTWFLHVWEHPMSIQHSGVRKESEPRGFDVVVELQPSAEGPGTDPAQAVT